MKKIYDFKSDVTNFCSFIELYPKEQGSIIGRAMRQRCQSFDPNTTAIVLKQLRSDTGRKNFQFDLSGMLAPFFVLSETALTALEDILSPRGQFLPVITESKKKRFFGYYPTNSLRGCFDKEKSEYREAELGLIVERPVLIAKNISDEYLFSVEADISRVFVTDKFKQRVEEAGLLAFDFSREIPTS
ncbi:hypothetical protein I6H07_07755 [Hafnia alvei]|uniref:hypothetical protein n=1 Tax=Hafnia alvei TaxID=569 RepID=UPI000B732532|nr:hypothetical protein [Hafnia alvei]MBI0275729.1 hypothetical protein [Hafnia alvei]PNK97936.1 hypothetical protein CEQ28_010225 [Hafnia alvei]